MDQEEQYRAFSFPRSYSKPAAELVVSLGKRSRSIRWSASGPSRKAPSAAHARSASLLIAW